MHTIEHIGFSDIWLQDPRIRIDLTIEGRTYFFGCYICTEQELCDFIRMRAAQIMRCGQFDNRMSAVQAEITCGPENWKMKFNDENHKFEI